MKCLCCGKELNSFSESGWHKSCIKQFFKTSVLPKIIINDEIISLLAIESVNKGLTIPGVQKKLSLHLINDTNKPKLTLVNYPTEYIFKPQVERFESLPESEHLIMSMADITGITTVPHALIKCNTGYAYITKRIDRIIDNSSVKMFAMEDFCQLDGRLTENKYHSSYERCSKIIKKYSSRIGIDITELFIRLVFSFIVGNSDMHLKNFSLIETFVGSREYVLSPAYDLLPVNAIMPDDKEQFALPMNGKKTNIRKKDFIFFGEECGIKKEIAERIIKKIINLTPKYLELCEEAPLSNELKKRIIEIIKARVEILS